MNHYPQEYIDFLVHFHTDRDFFECHEIMEEYWKENPTSALRQAWLGLIQVAVGLYHQRRNNVKGAIKMMRSAWGQLTVQDLETIGIDGPDFKHKLMERVTSLENGVVEYTDINIPIQDDTLLHLCKKQCENRNLIWLQPSQMSIDAIIHKHILRDRTEVIETRLKEKQKRDVRRQQLTGPSDGSTQ